MKALLGKIILLACAILSGCRDKSTGFEEQVKPPAVYGAPAAKAAEMSDWCAGHGVPESMCTKCNPALITPFQAAGDWCKEHHFPESVCPVCNPQPAPGPAAQAASDWCLEHAVPESKCARCNPDLRSQFQARGDWCAAHGFPESVCPICNPQLPPAGAEERAIEARIVRFRSPEIEAAAGIRTVAAQHAQAAAFIECTARIAFDSDRIADLRAIVPGIVRKIRADFGARVEPGEPLFELESTRVGDTQATLLTARERVRAARIDLARQRELRESNIVSARQLEAAEQELASARAEVGAAEAALRMAGAVKAGPSGGYTLVAPIAGTIVRRPAVVGLLATESTSLATIADTSVMWVFCHVPEADAMGLTLGQRVHVTVAGSDGEAIHGELTWIAAEVDPRTRTVTARAEVKNPNGRLRANQFARARIETSAPRGAVSVPRAAIQRVSEREVVFVRTEPGVFEPRIVRRYGSGDLVQVEGNLREGEPVVTTGAILLRTEVMPGSIGAGCCEFGPPNTNSGDN